MNISHYLSQSYPSPPCWELVATVLQQERGLAVTAYKTVNHSIRSIAAAFSLALHKSPHGFRQAEAPEDYAVVLMGRSRALGLHHAGVYYEGKVLHALDGDGGLTVLYQDMETLSAEYQLMEFWVRDPE